MRLTDAQALRLRFRAQGLSSPRATRQSVADVVRGVCGIQAQDTLAAELALRARLRGAQPQSIRQALDEERSIVRTWAQRGTLHWLAAEDLRWLISLFGPIQQAASRRRRQQLGLDDETTERGARLVRHILADGGPATRAEIVERLVQRGLQLVGQARPHLLAYASLDGSICQGPSRGREPTYVLVDDWLGKSSGPPKTREQSLADLACRFLSACGPARPEDLAAWSGLPSGEVRTGWGQLIDPIEVSVGGKPAWLQRAHARWIDDQQQPRTVRLLPAFDTYLLSYKDRSLAVPKEHRRKINAGGGMVRPTIVVDGRVVGTWRLERKAVELQPFGELDAAIEPEQIRAEIEAVERFRRAAAAETR